MNPNVYISFHDENQRQCQTIAAFLTENNYAVRYVPTDHVIADRQPAHILQDLVKMFYEPSDVVVCILGSQSANLTHVDVELYHALSGKPGVRKGIVALLMERPDISLEKIKAGNQRALSAIPPRLEKNLGYVELATFSRYRDLPQILNAAWKKAKDASVKVEVGPAPAAIKKGRYHDQ
ncbi:MAG: TIR domain-containing protein [Bacillota bacterium]|nr:TIR domain-containing protein [Bacillota bacterium]